MSSTDPGLQPHRIAGYGWRPDLPDRRDFQFAAPPERMVALPPSVDLEPHMPKVYDQGQLGSCTANAIAGAIEYELMQQAGQPDFTPSRLFIYLQERKVEGTVNTDGGAMLRDGMRVVSKIGYPPEADWPYIETNFSVEPPSQVYGWARQHTVSRYLRIGRSLQQMKACLADGFPFVFGFTVYDSFEGQQVAQTGVMTMPASGEAALGGHAVLAVGYDDATQCWKVRNSWGPSWGQHGYFWMPYQYLLQSDLSNDFWTIRQLAA